MAEAAPQQSESMEEILQSIKRIIEDDSAPDQAGVVSPAPLSGDVLELTQIIKEDGSLGSLPPLPSAKESVSETERNVAPMPAKPKPVSKPAPKPLQVEEGLVSDQAAQAAVAALKPIVDNAHKDYSIPHIPSSTLRNGNTVEDLLLEALKPMLKAWLDEHLPLIVHRIVEKEVKRIVTFHQD